MDKSESEILLESARAELSMAYGCDNKAKIIELNERITLLEKDIELRKEWGML